MILALTADVMTAQSLHMTVYHELPTRKMTSRAALLLFFEISPSVRPLRRPTFLTSATPPPA